MTRLNRDWVVQRHGPVKRLEDGLATVVGEIATPLGPFPRRMTVVSLPDSRSAIWSAVSLSEPAMREIEELGRPSFLVVPGASHRLDAAAWKARYPAIKVVCPPGAYAAVREAVPIDYTSDPFKDPTLGFEIVPGVGELESALVVRRGRTTLVLNDLLANVRNPRGLGARFIAWLHDFGLRRPQMPRITRQRLVSDAAALAGAFRRWAGLPGLSRVIVSHGEVIEDDPRGTLATIADELES